MKLCAICATLLFLVCARASSAEASAPSMPEYRWAAKTIYRFQYQKTIKVFRSSTGPMDAEPAAERPSKAGKPDTKAVRPERTTDFQGVVVIEVESVDGDGTATAVLRFDIPRLQLVQPAAASSDLKAAAEAAKDQSQVLALAMGETLREVRWRVTIDRRGAMVIQSRTPEKTAELLQRSAAAGAWRKKALQDMYAFIDNDLKLGGQGEDRELLWCTAPAKVAGAAGFETLRPYRNNSQPKARPEERVEYATERILPVAVDPAQPVLVDKLDRDEPPVQIFPGKAENSAGLAVFDAKLGMLDRAAESYRVSMKLRMDDRKRNVELDQAVEVAYRLTRLAPALRTAETEAVAQP